MTGTVLSVASRAVLEACEALGLDSDALLARAGVPRAQVYDPDARLPAAIADGLWMAAHEAAGDPDLALRAAAALPMGAYKVLDFVVAHAPNVEEALTRLARYFALVDQRAQLRIEGEGPVRLTFTSHLGPLPPQAQQYTLAAIAMRLRASAGEVPLEAVEFAFAEPPDVSEYRRVFGCSSRFDVAQPALVFARAALARPIATANPALLSVLDDHARRLVRELPPLEDDFAQRVRAALQAQLRGGEVSAAQLARQLGASERTLQRRLREAGHRYADLLTEVRRQAAEGYLRDRSIALCEVAWLLGFSEQSAFTRAFKRWTGQTPGAWRSEAAG